MMKDTGYINATKMCTSGGKDYKDWSRLKGIHELILALETLMERDGVLENIYGISASTLQDGNVVITTKVCKRIQTANTTPTEQLISGTYIHPDLVPSVAG